jgi:riboflavin synthase
MFTGIVTDLGRVLRVEFGPTTRLEIETGYDTSAIALGASIACSGICLSVVEKTTSSLSFDISNETIAKTNVGDWRVGRGVNLERALKMGDELGGHLVSGHVDGVGIIKSVEPDGGSRRMTVSSPQSLSAYIAPKGSVTIDGVSLTVNEVSGSSFGVNLIPITLSATSLGSAMAGERVNLEIDMIARYVARLLGKEAP